MRLIDVRANLERTEVTLQPMIESDNPDEAAIMKQIDKVAAQRAELEKANAQMLFAIRRVLTPEQWKKLQSLQPPQGPARMRIPGPPPPGGGHREGSGPRLGGGPPPAGGPPAGGNPQPPPQEE